MRAPKKGEFRGRSYQEELITCPKREPFIKGLNERLSWPLPCSCTPCPVSLSTFKPHSLHPEDGGSKVFQNIGFLPH